MAEVNLPRNFNVRLEKSKPFPKLTIEKPDYYISPNRAITGRILKPIDIKFYRGMGLTAPLNTQEVAIEIDFTPAGRSTPPQNRAEVLEARNLGLSDFNHFLESLRSKAKFRNVGLIVGRTNPRMANFVVKRYGFHYGRLPDEEGEKRKILDDPESKITVFITKEELLIGNPPIPHVPETGNGMG